MNARDRLHQMAELMPPGSSVSITREDLLEALAGSGAADLTVGQVAARFGRALSTVRSWLEQGLLRGYRLRGREWRIPLAAVAEFEQREREGRPRKPTSQRGVTRLDAWRGEGAA